MKGARWVFGVAMMAALGASTACGKSPERRDVDLIENGPSGFECARAAELLGHPKAMAKDCKEYLPGLWRVVLTGGDFAEGWQEVVRFVWRDGRRDVGTGVAALGTYLRESKIATNATLDTFAVQVLLEATGGVPQGFAPSDLGQTLDGVESGVSVNPFQVVLLRRQPLNQPGDEPTPPGGGPPGGGPLGGGPPGGGPPGGGPPGGGPPGGGPPGGGPVLGLRRATLSAVGDRFQWLIEDRSAAPGSSWVELGRETF